MNSNYRPLLQVENGFKYCPTHNLMINQMTLWLIEQEEQANVQKWKEGRATNGDEHHHDHDRDHNHDQDNDNDHDNEDSDYPSIPTGQSGTLLKGWLKTSRLADPPEHALSAEDSEAAELASARDAKLKKVFDPIKTVKTKDWRKLSEQVDKAMPELSESTLIDQHGVVYTQVFNKSNVLSAVKGLEGNREKTEVFQSLVPLIVQHGGYRRLVKPETDVLQKLTQLKAKFPNFTAVIDHYRDEFRIWSVTAPENWSPMPVLLDGKPGTGKTAFAKALAEVLKVPFYGINLGGTSAGFVLKGSASQWGSSREGQILSALATSTCANPVLLLDEIDKATGDKQYNVEPVLLELLEPATARRFTDEFAPLTFNAAHGIYIGTSNNTAKLSRPLLSRFEVISIPPPDQDQRLLIAKNMVEQQFSNLEFDEEALWILAGRASNLRTLQRLIRKVVASYVTHRCRDSASASPPGRVTVFHAEQICHL